jgi:hypothetical protein
MCLIEATRNVRPSLPAIEELLEPELIVPDADPAPDAEPGAELAVLPVDPVVPVLIELEPEPPSFSQRPRTSTRCPTCFCRFFPTSVTLFMSLDVFEEPDGFELALPDVPDVPDAVGEVELGEVEVLLPAAEPLP